MKIFILIACLLLSSCSTVTIHQKDINGAECSASRIAFFMSSSAIQGEACGAKAGASDSKADNEAIAAGIAFGLRTFLNGEN